MVVVVVVGGRRGMSRGQDGREVVMLCEECHSKMLAVGELLLLSCEARPVFTSVFDLQLSRDTFMHYRDKVVDKLNHILITSRDIYSHVHCGGGVQWKSMAGRVQELGQLVTGLTELSAHIGYLIAVNFPRCSLSRLGVVNKYKVHQAKLDLRFCCSRLKRSCVDDLDPHLLVELCSTMSRALSSVTEVCRHAGEKAADVDDQNQFKLCIKSVTSTTSCLIASVKRFKSSPSIDHLRRIIAFCDPVVSTSSALVTFASEDEFIGQAAKLSEKATEAHKSVLGMTMSIVSASIQMCKAIRDLVYDVSNTRHRERIRLCVDSTDKASSKLRDLLLSCDFEPKAGGMDIRADDARSSASLTRPAEKTVTVGGKSNLTGAKPDTDDGKNSLAVGRSRSADEKAGRGKSSLVDEKPANASRNNSSAETKSSTAEEKSSSTKEEPTTTNLESSSIEADGGSTVTRSSSPDSESTYVGPEMRDILGETKTRLPEPEGHISSTSDGTYGEKQVRAACVPPATVHVPSAVTVLASADVPASVDELASPDVSASEDVLASADVSASEGVLASANVSASVDVLASADVSASEDVLASADVPASVDVSASADVSTPVDLSASADMPASVDVSASADMPASVDVSILVDVTSTVDSSTSTDMFHSEGISNSLVDNASSSADVSFLVDVSPSADDLSPLLDVSPSVDDVSLSVDDVSLSLDDVSPTVDNLSPLMDVSFSADVPSLTDVPHATDAQPSVDDEPPSVNDEPPSLNDEPPSVDNVPCSVNEPPSVDDEPYSVDDELSSVDDEPPSMDDKLSSVDDELPSVDDEPPSVDNKPPSVDDDVHCSVDDVSISTDESSLLSTEAACCSSLDASIGSGEGHSGWLDLKAVSGDMEKAVTVSGLMASSPVLNLSTYSVGSISDSDLWPSVMDRSSHS